MISGQAELLLLTGQLVDENREKVEAILRNVYRAASLTSQLLAFSRKQVIQLEVLDLGPLLKDFSKMLPRVLGETISLEFTISSDLKRIKADQGQLTQVLLNLCLNSRDAMPEGGKLVISAKNIHISPGEEKLFHDVPAGSYVTLVVQDNGEGIPEHLQGRIFEPFFTTKEPGKGTGLGLNTLSAVVEQTGGSVRFSSNPGRGTTFRIYLPETEAKMTDPHEEPVTPALTLDGSVLVVEDEEGIRETIEAYLRAQNVAMVVARSGKEALEKLTAQDIKLAAVITDMVMPDMGGLELVRILEQQGYDCAFIFMSGYTDQQMTFDVQADQNKRYLQKPFKLAELERAIRQTTSLKKDSGLDDSGKEPANGPLQRSIW
jgi:two-component system, cell cycle sensor histidine kinase and response regulator CckA